MLDLPPVRRVKHKPFALGIPNNSARHDPALAEKSGQVFTLENLNPIDHPGCSFGSTAAVLGLVSAVNRPQLRINLDLYHTQIGEGDLIRWCEACLPWLGEVQVADNPGRCEPGTGEINYPAIAGR
jgi:hydroxypyruvate isomerase